MKKFNFINPIKLFINYLNDIVRKLIITFLIIGSFAWNVSAQSSNQAQKFSLEQCIEYALQATAPVIKAQIDTRIAEAQIKEIKAQGYPQLNGNINMTNNFKLQTSFLPAIFFAEDPASVPTDAKPFPVQFGVQYSGLMTASARQLIFDGSFFLGLKAAKTFQELSVKGLERTKIEVVASITKAYYSVLVNQERLGLLQQNVNRLETLLRETRALYENGFAEKIDADRIEVTHNNIKTELRKTERLVALSFNILKYQMGMPLDTPFDITQTLADIELNKINLNESYDYNDRIEFSLLDTQLELDQLNVKRYQVQYYPTLYANFNYGINAGANEFSGMDRWFRFGSYGFQVSIPIFDGFRKKSLIQQAKLTMQKTEVDKVDLMRTIDLETSQAKINLQNAINDLEVQERNMELAKEIMRVSKIKLNEGVGSTLELVDAETSYKEAETNYYASVYDALISIVDYKKATGKLYKEQ